MFPVVLVLGAFSREVLALWLGPRIAQEGYAVLSLLCLGAMVNPIGQVAVALLHALGRARITATFHLVEFPIYVVLLLVLTPRLGLPGVALAWSARIALDALLLFRASQEALPCPGIVDRDMLAAALCLATMLVLCSLGVSPKVRAPGAVAILIFYISALYRHGKLPSRDRLATLLWP